jgi:4-hydroxy-tetrahydrodipicolinate synthase
MISREKVRHALTGPIMSLNTPFNSDGSIDYPSVRRIIDFTIAGGSKTVILTMGDGLFTLLTDQEVGELTKFVADYAAGRAMVVAADRMWWTGKTIEFAKYCGEIKADLLMVQPPDWAGSCTVDTVVEHYAAIGKHIPLMLVTAFLEKWPLPKTVELLEKLRDRVPNLCAVKDDVCGELGRRLGLIGRDRWAMFTSGNKRVVLANRPYGYDGYMSTFISFKPEIVQDFWKAVVANDEVKTLKIINEVDIPLWDFVEPFPGGFDAAVHGMLELRGLCKRRRRSPYYSLNDREMETLSQFLKTKGWL